jgi:hypothetical protein
MDGLTLTRSQVKTYRIEIANPDKSPSSITVMIDDKAPRMGVLDALNLVAKDYRFSQNSTGGE